MGRKDPVSERRIDDKLLKAQLKGYADKDEAVRKEPQAPYGLRSRSAGEDITDLGDNDRGQAGCRGLQIKHIVRGKRSPPAPSPAVRT